MDQCERGLMFLRKCSVFGKIVNLFVALFAFGLIIKFANNLLIKMLNS